MTFSKKWKSKNFHIFFNQKYKTYRILRAFEQPSSSSGWRFMAKHSTLPKLFKCGPRVDPRVAALSKPLLSAQHLGYKGQFCFHANKQILVYNKVFYFYCFMRAARTLSQERFACYFLGKLKKFLSTLLNTVVDQRATFRLAARKNSRSFHKLSLIKCLFTSISKGNGFYKICYQQTIR